MSSISGVTEQLTLTLGPKEGKPVSGPSSGGPVVVDLFAGAGGLSLGAEAAGCDVRLAVDFDHLACETMRRNTAGTGLQVLETDVSALSGAALRELARVRNSDPLVIVGGPPCQGFSKAAFWTEEGDDARYRQARARGEDARRPPTPLSPPNKDERRSLIFEYWRLVAESDANGFVFENVPSLLAPRHRPMFDRLAELAEDAGFKTTLVKANAAEFGVAQKRNRIFLLGAKDFVPVAPTPTHSLEPTDGLPPVLTAGQALKSLDSPRFHEPEEVVKGRWANHLEEIPPGWNYKWHTEWAGHPDPTFVTETRYWNFLLKLSPDLPSWTIAASPGPWTGPFHWSSRRLRTVELAALQGFPGEYEFAGSRRERVRQIGNAVPPPLAAHMVEAVASKMRADFVAA